MCVCKDDNWRSVNYQNEDSVHKFEADMKQLGIDDIQQYTFGQYSAASAVYVSVSLYVILNALFIN